MRKKDTGSPAIESRQQGACFRVAHANERRQTQRSRRKQKRIQRAAIERCVLLIDNDKIKRAFGKSLYNSDIRYLDEDTEHRILFF